jgi:glycosyltransferase involved in cell wall biosynthesis
LTTVNRFIKAYGIVLIDDRSADCTGEITEAMVGKPPNVRALHNIPNIGLRALYQRGVGETKLDYVMTLSNDGGLMASSLPAIIE